MWSHIFLAAQWLTPSVCSKHQVLAMFTVVPRGLRVDIAFTMLAC